MPPSSRTRPTAAQRRRATPKDSPGVQIEVDGRTYVIRQSDLTPRDAAALRKETGFAGWIGLMTEAERGFDLDVLGAFLWLARRIKGEFVPYDSVLDELSYDVDVKVQVEDKGAPAAEVESPEA